MKRYCLFVATLLAIGCAGRALAQDLPRSQPKFLTIYREKVKAGQAGAHNRFEVGYPAALEKSKSPDYYLAMISLTGAGEAWYVQPCESYAAMGESMKRDEKDPVLSAELERLDQADAEYTTSREVLRAKAKPELSVGGFPDLSKARFFEITTFRIKPGREGQFEEIAKAYAAIMKRAPNSSYRMYEVLAGDRLPTYLVFSSVESYAEIDQRMEEGEEAFKKATPEEMAVLGKFHEVAESIVSNEFRLDPAQSYVSKATRERDPAFWMAK